MKNPWMSLWLSAANSYAGVARGAAAAEAAKAQKAASAEMARQITAFWFPFAAEAQKPTRRRSPRKRRR